jgi:pimeloyl-ACP methyl ester carboxylesterase
VEVGPPAASLSLWVLEPRGTGAAGGRPPRGTILLLHGWRKQKAGTLRLAEVLNGDGFRAVAVDLRGHGRSTGDWMTYGAIEARDLSQVLDALEARGLVAGPIGVFGISYGAAVGIQFAARDRRVGAVVAVACFSSLRTAIPRYVRLFLPVFGWFMSEAQIQAAIDRAAERAGFAPDGADAGEAMARVRAPVLLIHGKGDWLIPPHHSQTLFRAGNPSTELVLLDGYGHNSIFRDSRGELKRESLNWFARWLKQREAVILGPPLLDGRQVWAYKGH